MNAVPLRWNPLLRDLAKPMVSSLITANLVFGILGARRSISEFDAQPWIVLIVWLTPALFVMWTGLRGRDLKWETALPLAPQALWRVHLSALAVAAFLVWLASTASIWLMFGLVRWAGDTWLHDPVEVLVACLAGGVALAPLAAWFHGRRPELRVWNGPGWLDAVVAVVAALLGLAVVDRPLWGITAIVLGTAGLVRGGLVRVPGAWTIPMGKGTEACSGEAFGGTAARWSWSLDARLYWMILRAVPRGVLTGLSVLPMAAAFGFLMSGAMERILPGSELRLLFAPITAYLMLAGSAFPMAGIRALDALPVARTRVLTLVLAPVALLYLLGYGVGTVWNLSAVQEGEPILFVDEEERYGLLVPLRLFEVGPVGPPPVVEAPWGESHEMLAIPVFGVDGNYHGDQPMLWKPYTTPRGASREFVAWQLARAVEAYYGKTLDHVELADRYFVVNPDGQVGVRGGELTFAADHPELRVRGVGPVLPAAVALLAPLWLLPLAAFLSVCRSRYSVRRRRIVIWSAMGVLMLMHILAFLSPAFGLMRPDRIEVATLSWLQQTTLTLPGGALMLWALALAILAAGLLLVRRGFRSLEADHSATTVCLLASPTEG